MSLTSRLRTTFLCLSGIAVAVLVSCGREITAPTGDGVSLVRHGLLSFEPVFPRLPGGRSVSEVVAFERVRVVLHRADGSVALDTIVEFPVGADTVVLATSVALSPSTGSGGENFKLDLGYMNAAGQVVFVGGPVDLTVVPKGSSNQPAPVQIPLRYSGPGASASRVVISPPSVSVNEGQSFSFTAAATDASGTTLPNTPIVWASLDPNLAVLSSSLGGAGQALATRGTARIVAQLLTGPSDTAIVTIVLVARKVAKESGDAQTAAVNSALPQPIAVKVTASDGVGVAGVNVTFAVSDGGSVASSTVATDANGVASTTWTLGAPARVQTATATTAGLAGSPVSFTATARSVAPTRLVFTVSPPSSNNAGTPLPVTVSALDAQGDIAKTFTGTVTLTLAEGSTIAPLLGTLTAAAVGGVATFPDVRINLPGSGYLLTASASGFGSITTPAFAVVSGPAQRLEFGSYPVFGAIAGPLDDVAAIARDAAGNVATGFTGQVTVTLVLSSTGAPLLGATTATAVGGIATFGNLSITAAGRYQLGATASGLSDGRGPAFDIVGGPAARLVLLSGGDQSGTTGSVLARPIVVGMVDRFGNPTSTPVSTIAFAASHGGGATPSSGATDASGQRSITWTLGGSPGVQQLTATSGVLTSLVVSATATGGASGIMAVYGGNNQFAVANTAVLTPPSVIVKNAAGQPVSGVAVTFTPSAGSSITGASLALTNASGIATVGGWTLGGTGSYTLTASASGYASVVFTGTVNTVPMSVTSAEKLPNGTQQFSVVGGNSGDTYTWSVNGFVGGNSTFGTITASGFYTAPPTVPNPSTFAVCAQSNQTPGNKGCINVTINDVPTAGGELIVINDINWGDLGLYNYNSVYNYPGNVQFVKNLVNFAPVGVRSSASKVLLVNDYGTNHTFSGGWPEVGKIIKAQGYTTEETTSHASLTNIPADVKVVMLVMPGIIFSRSEINGLKTFASQGGRIIFFGENGGYYYYSSFGKPVEDAFLSDMGAVMTNTGACDAPGVIVNSNPHQLTAGIAPSGAGGFYMNCVSHMNLGPNDFALMEYAGVVVAAIAKIDLTLLPPPPNALRQSRAPSEKRNPGTPTIIGLPGWTSTGPLSPRP